MDVKDIMTKNVISVRADALVLQAAQLMLQNHISGLPVVDDHGVLIGIVTEGDFLRRSELGTERHRSRWLEFLVGPGRLAADYAHASGRKIEEVMTREPYAVSESDSLDTVVALMERQHVKRLPVTKEGRLAGIISRSDLMREMAHQMRLDMQTPSGPDATIRADILRTLGKLHWAPDIKVDVRDGVVDLSGTIMDENERQGIVVAVENVPGVKKVHDHIVWVEPMSAVAFPSPEDEASKRAAAS